MFGIKKGKARQSSIDSLIGAGTRIEGNVIFSGACVLTARCVEILTARMARKARW